MDTKISKISDLSAQVLVVDPSSTFRMTITESIRAAGFAKVFSVSCYEDAIQLMEVEDIDWVIGVPSSIFGGSDRVTLIQMLHLSINSIDLQHVAYTAVLEEGSNACLEALFHFGLLSFIYKPFTRNSLVQSVADLVKEIKADDNDLALVAAQYLKKVLIKPTEMEAESELNLCKSLLELHPGNGRVLFDLAVSYHRNKNYLQAIVTMTQVAVIDPSLEEKAGEYVRRWQKAYGNSDANSAASSVNALGIKSAMIVDGDGSANGGMIQVLKAFGCPAVKSFSDGESAWADIVLNGAPDVILMEWKISKVSGPQFVQRVRNLNSSHTIVIVVSSLIDQAGAALVKEIGVSAVVAKPFSRKDLSSALVWSLKQDRMPTDLSDMERKFRVLLRSNSRMEASELKSRFVADRNIPQWRRNQMDAEWALYNNDYKTAKALILEAIKYSQPSFFNLGLLGKALIKNNELIPALNVLKKAHELSPLNIERICEISQTEASLGKVEDALGWVDIALTIDADSSVASTTMKSLAAADQSNLSVSDLMTRLSSTESVIAYLNNRGAVLSKTGSYSEAFIHYTQALQAGGDRVDPFIRGAVHYNYALTLARATRLQEAADNLFKTMALVNDDREDNRLLRKAKSLYNRVQNSIKTGEPLNISAETMPVIEECTVVFDEVANLGLRKGDRCLYLIYEVNQLKLSRFMPKNREPIRFVKRDAIHREATHSAEAALIRQAI